MAGNKQLKIKGLILFNLKIKNKQIKISSGGRSVREEENN